jgi:hypothetical protein
LREFLILHTFIKIEASDYEICPEYSSKIGSLETEFCFHAPENLCPLDFVAASYNLIIFYISIATSGFLH